MEMQLLYRMTMSLATQRFPSAYSGTQLLNNFLEAC